MPASVCATNSLTNYYYGKGIYDVDVDGLHEASDGPAGSSGQRTHTVARRQTFMCRKQWRSDRNPFIHKAKRAIHLFVYIPYLYIVLHYRPVYCRAENHSATIYSYGGRAKAGWQYIFKCTHILYLCDEKPMRNLSETECDILYSYQFICMAWERGIYYALVFSDAHRHILYAHESVRGNVAR